MRIIFLLATASLLAAPAFAQDAAQPAAQNLATDGHAKTTFLATYDADGDGKVALKEFRDGRLAGYATRDADGDGAVNEAEYLGEYEARLRAEQEAEFAGQMEQAKVRFGVLDEDADGAMTWDEFDASGDIMFTDLDTNGDGIVDDADTAAAY